MKKTDKSISQFHGRLEKLLGKDFESISQLLGVSVSTIRDRWYKGSYPGADKIKIIIEKTGCSADWLLTGKEPVNEAASLFARHIDMLKKIHNSNDQTYIQAIDQNLTAFVKAVQPPKTSEPITEDKIIRIVDKVIGDRFNAEQPAQAESKK